MNGGECGYSCAFCQKGFRSLDRKLQHLKACKEVFPSGKAILPVQTGLQLRQVER
jgi:hypothetical protein